MSDIESQLAEIRAENRLILSGLAKVQSELDRLSSKASKNMGGIDWSVWYSDKPKGSIEACIKRACEVTGVALEPVLLGRQDKDTIYCRHLGMAAANILYRHNYSEIARRLKIDQSTVRYAVTNALNSRQIKKDLNNF